MPSLFHSAQYELTPPCHIQNFPSSQVIGLQKEIPATFFKCAPEQDDAIKLQPTLGLHTSGERTRPRVLAIAPRDREL